MTDPDARTATTAPWSHGVLVEPDVTLHAIEWTASGAGTRLPDILLVHGLASNAQLWAGMAQRLAARGHRVVAVDQRGHGLSSKPDAGFGFPRLVDDLAGVIDSLRLDRPIAVGQSWGANVVLELAATSPGRVRGVGLVDGGHIELHEQFDDVEHVLEILRPPPLAGLPLDDLEENMRRRMQGWPEAGIRGQLANFRRHPDGTISPHLTLERHLAILRSLWDHRPSERFASIEVPVLWMPVRGGPVGGGPAKEAAIERARRLLATSRTHWFDGAHDIHAQEPDEVVAVISEAITDGFFA